jgi:hypothetical protein
MKIFLDDIRKIDENLGNAVVRNYESCIELISNSRNDLDFVSLDYSLGSEKTGLDVLVYMVENRIYPNHINIHSDHEVGVPIMRKYVQENFSNYIMVTFNKIKD